MKTVKILLVMFLGALAIENRVAMATPSSDLTYIETGLTGGWWQYDYWLSLDFGHFRKSTILAANEH